MSTPVTRRGGLLAFIALLAVAANLRSPLTSLPPLVEDLGAALGLSSIAAGTLTSVPLVCMGLLSPLAPRLAARYGLDRSIGLGVALIAVGTAARGFGGVPGLYLGTLLLGTGIAIAGALVPAAVRHRPSHNIGGATSLMNAVTMSMAALAAATVAPLAGHLDWSVALAVWAVPAVLALAVWTPQMAMVPPGPARGRATLPWRAGTAWLITGYLTANSLMFYSLVAWLPGFYLDRGWSETAAGLVLGVFTGWQLLIALVLSALLRRWRADRRPLYVAAAVLSGVGVLGVVLVPPAGAWVVVAVVGVGLGGGFTLGLVQLAVHAETALDSARLSAMVFLVSFLCAAAGPPLAGWSRDALGSFTPAFVILALLAAGQVLIGMRLHPRRRVGPEA